MKIKQKIANWIIKLIGKELDEIKRIRRYTDGGDTFSNADELNQIYLFDFTNPSSFLNGGFTISGFQPTEQDSNPDSPHQIVEKKFQKIKIKPIDVLDELEKIPTPFSLNNLDDKIYLMKEKRELITQRQTKREVEAYIERLENRKKYLEHKEFFDNFQNTNNEKIQLLLKKYDLVMKSSEIFIPEYPAEAITIMRQYTEKVMQICGKKPVFYVIATEDNFQEAYQQRDPILLVQSPFGFYFQVLGAWSDEMMLLSEL
jgi:hypothetical protein